MPTGALANHRLVKCTCNYLCKRVDPAIGHQFITARTRRKPILMDRRNELASEIALSRERLRRRSARIAEQAPIAPLPSDIIGHTIVRPVSENRTEVDGRVVSGCRTTIWKYTKMATVMSSLTGLQQNPYLDAEEEIGETGDQSGAQVEANLLNATLPSQVHVSSTLNQYFPTLDEAVYRETWKLQALLDASNVHATAQDTVLKSLFGDSPEHRIDHLGREDYRGWGLGQLLRHAGSDWTGGELGLRVLRSVNSIHDVYKSAGMPKVVRWRLCIGEEGLGDPRNIALMGYWDGFQSASSVMRSTWIVGLKIINAGSSSNIPSMPVLFIPNTKSESLGKVDLLGAGEIIDDVVRHGPSHVYWCYGFERLVSGYNKVKTNSGNMEHTFTMHYARTFFQQCLSQRWEDDDGLFPQQRAELLIHSNLQFCYDCSVESSIPGSCVNWHSDGVVLVSTISKAKQVWDLSSNYPESSLCCMKVTTQGIGVGGQRRKMFSLSRQQTSYLSRYWRTSMRLDSNSELPSFSCTYKSLKAVLLRGKIFRVGDYAVVADERQTPLLLGYEWNWKVRVTKLFTHSCGQKTEMFFECTWLYNIMVGDQQKVDNLSGMQLLETRERSVEADNWRPVNQLGHHFLPLLRRGDNEILALELSDSRRREHLFNTGGIGFPPPYPIVNDVMLASHLSSCQVRTLDTCVIREVLEVVNTATVAEIEDALSDDDSLDDTLTDASVGLSEDIPVDRGQYEFSPAALSQVQVQWLKKNNRGQWVVRNDTCCETLCFSNLHNVHTGFSEVGFRGGRSVRWEEDVH
ncbi:hypothetical protein R1sor_016377 [Riccia sorocarpa]|uniref:Uncharacterized protein n=1 Tax=Riccia sorocarpa TaxID=122646 RepID=A0ABD3HFA0_9MARC